MDGEYETIRYTNKRISTWSNDNADYNFVFKNGKLVEFGTSNVRSNKLGLFRYDGKFISSVGKNGPWQWCPYHHPNERYHESLDNVTPADMYHGRRNYIMNEREFIKQKTLRKRTILNQKFVSISIQISS